jgi:hypothetical protein
VADTDFGLDPLERDGLEKPAARIEEAGPLLALRPGDSPEPAASARRPWEIPAVIGDPPSPRGAR